MKKAFKKFGVLVLSLLLIVAAMPICAIAADGIDVKLSGINVTAAEGTIGVGVAEKGKDYTTVLTAREGYEIFHIMVYGIGSAPDDVYHPSFEFDYETGVLTVSKEEFNYFNCIYIEAIASEDLNYESDITTVSEFPYSDTFILEETDITKEFGFAGKTGFAGKIFKVDLSADEALEMEFYGTDNTDADSFIIIYTYNEESGFEHCREIDYNNLVGNGEKAVFISEVAETYYIVTMCYNEYIGERYSLELSITEKEPVPTPGTGTGSGSIAGGSDDIIIDVIIPDVENPDIPNTSVESNATALAVLSLTVGGALLLTFKRKEK